MILKSPVLNCSLSFPQARVLTSVRNVRGRSFVLLTFKDIYAITQERNRTNVKNALGPLHAPRTWSVICARTQEKNPINVGSALKRSLSQGVYRLTYTHTIKSLCKWREWYRTRRKGLEIGLECRNWSFRPTPEIRESRFLQVVRETQRHLPFWKSVGKDNSICT